LDEGLPTNLDAERVVLACVLMESDRFCEVPLEADDFSLEWHRRIFRRMHDLHDRNEHIDVNTVWEELRRHGETNWDSRSNLLSLDEGMPRFPSLASHVRIVHRKSVFRRGILMAQKFMDACLLEIGLPGEMLDGHLAEIEALRAACKWDQQAIRRVEDLESIFAKRTALEYVIQPELPVKSIVCLTGDSESGKTTLACAWARDAHAKGHPVLILDRDKNPRDRICERLERLGIRTDDEHFWVWDCEQEEDPPQPDDPRIVDWVKRMLKETGKSPLVIPDSLISFFQGDEDENDAVDMRALFDRCRVLTKLGATVVPIHHTNRSGEARGSSDFKPASDQAFLVKNCDRSGGRLLDIIMLTCEKSRYGLSGRIVYHYADGKMLRIEDIAPTAPTQSAQERFTELLKANPGILAGPYADMAAERNLGRNQAREYLKTGASNGTIRVKKAGRKHHHFWRGSEDEPADSDEQGGLY
jgi:hypothetical protein